MRTRPCAGRETGRRGPRQVRFRSCTPGTRPCGWVRDGKGAGGACGRDESDPARTRGDGGAGAGGRLLGGLHDLDGPDADTRVGLGLTARADRSHELLEQQGVEVGPDRGPGLAASIVSGHALGEGAHGHGPALGDDLEREAAPGRRTHRPAPRAVDRGDDAARVLDRDEAAGLDREVPLSVQDAVRHRPDGLRALAEELVEEVGAVHDVVDQGTAAGELGVGEPGPVLRQLAVVDAGDAEDRPEASAAQLGHGSAHGGGEPHRVRHHEEHARAVTGIAHRDRVLDRRRQRLLAQHVHPRGRRLLHQRAVTGVLRGHHDRVRTPGESLVVGLDVRDPELRGQGAAARGVVRSGDAVGVGGEELDVGHLLQCVHVAEGVRVREGQHGDPQRAGTGHRVASSATATAGDEAGRVTGAPEAIEA